MKKIKVLLSALAMVAAFGFVSCSNGSDGTSSPVKTPTQNPDPEQEVAKLCKVEYSAQWGGATTVIPEGAKAVKYVFASVPSDIQFIYQDNETDPAVTSYKAYWSAYSGAITETEVTIDLAEALEKLKTAESGNPNATRVPKVVLQNMKDGANSIVVSSITIIKADDTEVSAGVPEGDWAATVTAL